ncbi:MAG: hypothetical protein ACYCS1_08730 [Gammaproteobacteria bacterium]
MISKLFGIFLRLLLLAVILATPAYLFLANFAVFEPFLFPLHYLQGNVHHVSQKIIVGPYPDEGLLKNLHHRGIRIVVSLLDPHLIYEKSLIEREDHLTKELGMTAYNFPMDSAQPPGSALNARAMHNIRVLIRKYPRVKMYIHCYLGKHRVGDVASMLIKWFGKNREGIAVPQGNP